MSPAFTTASPPEGEVAQVPSAPTRENRKNKRHDRRDIPYTVASRQSHVNAGRRASPPPGYHEKAKEASPHSPSCETASATTKDDQGAQNTTRPRLSQGVQTLKSSVPEVQQRAKQPMPKTKDLPIVESNEIEDKRARSKEIRLKNLVKAREAKRLKKAMMIARGKKLQEHQMARRMNK